MGTWSHHVFDGLQSSAIFSLREKIDLQDDQVRVAKFHAQSVCNRQQALH